MEANMIPFRHPGQERRRLSIFAAVLATLALVLAFLWWMAVGIGTGCTGFSPMGRNRSRFLWTLHLEHWENWTADW